MILSNYLLFSNFLNLYDSCFYILMFVCLVFFWSISIKHRKKREWETIKQGSLTDTNRERKRDTHIGCGSDSTLGELWEVVDSLTSACGSQSNVTRHLWKIICPHQEHEAWVLSWISFRKIQFVNWICNPRGKDLEPDNFIGDDLNPYVATLSCNLGTELFLTRSWSPPFFTAMPAKLLPVRLC